MSKLRSTKLGRRRVLARVVTVRLSVFPIFLVLVLVVVTTMTMVG
jgi:hypothetical protein